MKAEYEFTNDEAIFASANLDKKLNLVSDNGKIKILSKASLKSDYKMVKHVPEPLEQLHLHLKMREKFDDLYKQIKKISHHNLQEIKEKLQKKYITNQEIPTHRKPIHHLSGIRNQTNKTKFKHPWEDNVPNNHYNYLPNRQNLQINNASNSKTQQMPVKMVRSARYHKPTLQPIKNANLSSNVRDYLSACKIHVKQAQQSLLFNIKKAYKSKQVQRDHSPFSTRINSTKSINQLFNTNSTKSLTKKQSKNKKFTPPFQTYYFRDIIWRVGYSNQQVVKAPSEYEQRIKVFLGEGNNSKLIRSIIYRRPWYIFTDNPQQASIIWTQIKIPACFLSQSSNKRQMEFLQSENAYIPDEIWSQKEDKEFKVYFYKFLEIEEKQNQQMKFRNKNFKVSLQEMKKIKIQNHLINNYIISNKKALFKTMSSYYKEIGQDVFEYLPLTFHICNGIQDDQYLKFLQHFYAIGKEIRKEEAESPKKKSKESPQKNKKYNAWILKPGQNTNRGQGITVCLNLQSIKAILKNKTKHQDGTQKTYILQKYIERPFLYKKRKFDLRHFIMINCSNGIMKGYWFKDGYARTTSTEYTLKQGNGNIHLTNDAVQKQLPEYGKYEKGNKISYEQLADYMSKLNKKYDFMGIVYPKMKKIAIDVIKASANNLDPERRTNNFQIFGLDFMFDEQLNVFLIEVNTNPCLEISCPFLSKIMPTLIENTFQIAIDPLYPPPLSFNPKGSYLKGNCVEEMRYELIYDERLEGENNSGTDVLNDEKFMKDQDDLFEDDGEQWPDL